ncbi:putative oxidoreductase YrbE [Nomia melanderi]|uniref:putative oxidoreductase YrbE n=1 Tax=Nomia melanderi TaxID=2448451 RepID=UPI0013047C08|nr:uncharacterized protein LOC116425829 [Nomia melanderi]
MATAKFKDTTSPFARKQPSPPAQDFLHQQHLENISLKTDARKERVKLALFGVGRAGSTHLSNIIANRRIQLLYIVDDVESNWEKIREYWHLNDVTFLNSKQSSKVFRDPNIDAVLVASPTYTHGSIVRQALEAKKAVFCEKPIAEDRTTTLKCYETAQKVGKPLLSAFNRRFDPSIATIKQRVRNGEVGHVHIIKTVCKDSPLPSMEYLKTSSGIFHDCMIHDIDTITWILGELPCKVNTFAHAHTPEIKEMGDFDTVAVTLYYPSGTIAMIDASRTSAFGYDQRLEVYGTKGLISLDNERPLHGVTSQIGLQGITQSPIHYSFPSRFKYSYQRELDHFIDVLFGKTELAVMPKETLAACKIATACEESAKTNKVVEIKWTDDELLTNSQKVSTAN